MNTLSSLLNFIGNYIGKVETLPTVTSVANAVTFEKVGKVVTIHVTNVNNLASGQTDLVTLPKSWRPKSNRALNISDPRYIHHIRLNVANTGLVHLYNYDDPKSGTTNASGTLTYIVGGVIRSLKAFIRNVFRPFTLGKGVA